MQTPLEVLTPINMERKFSSLAREKKGLETLYIIRFKKKNIGGLEGVVFTALHTNFTFMNTRRKKNSLAMSLRQGNHLVEGHYPLG